MTTMQSFRSPSLIRCGGGSRHEVGQLVRQLNATRVLVVTDPGVIQLGLHTDVLASLKLHGCTTEIFSAVQPDPSDTNVRDGLRAAQAHKADVLVAIGGGSAMDCAKVLAIAVRHGDDLPSWSGRDRIPGPGIPLIAVPTTAGTGSEASSVAVITNTSAAVKMLMLSPHLMPRIAIVDFELSLGMPRGLTAAVGVDTLTHGIESYVSRQAGPLTDSIALSCIELCGRFLERAWRDGSDREAREGMMAAACQGGMAFTNSSVALVHGMSRPIGALFHLPHGLSNAVLLPSVTAWSLPAASARYATVARTLGLAASSDSDLVAGKRLVEYLVGLNERLAIPSLGVAIKTDI
ncbi:MAG: iron-containing alcohol dehydrogenase, partial [Planctomycetota bacterium]